jgi:hypothetical protein
MAPMIGACVSLSWQILQLLLTSKGNKQEQKSLQSAVTNINRFLKAITADGVSDEGNEVLSEWCRRICPTRAWYQGCLIDQTAGFVYDGYTQKQHQPVLACFSSHLQQASPI